MAHNHRLTALVAFAIGFSVLIIGSILLATNSVNNYQYGVIIESGYRNSSFHLFRWCEKRVNLTAKPESIDTCIGEFLTNSSLDAIDRLLTPCLSKLSSTHSLSLPDDKNQKSTSPLWFAGSGQLRLLLLSSPDEAKQLVASTSTYLRNRTQFDVQGVSIVDERSEAVYSWIAGNAHRLESAALSPRPGSVSNYATNGVLDLSDLTSHIAWENNTANKGNVDVIEVRLFGRNHTLISRSDMCLGSDEAKLRLTILLIKDHVNNNETQPIDDPCLPINSTRSVKTDHLLADVCLKGTLRANIPAKRRYTLLGKGDPQKCSDLISKEILNLEACNRNFDRCFKPGSTPRYQTFVALNDYLQPIDALNMTSHNITDTVYYERTQVVCKLSAAQILPKMPVERANEVCFRLNYNYWLLKSVHQISGNWSDIIWDKSMQNWSKWPLGMMMNATNSLPVTEPKEPFFNLIHFLIFAVCSLTMIVVGVIFFVLSLRERRVQNKEVYEPIQQQAM